MSWFFRTRGLEAGLLNLYNSDFRSVPRYGNFSIEVGEEIAQTDKVLTEEPDYQSQVDR